LSPIGVRDAGEIERAVARFAQGSDGGLIVTGGPLTAVHRDAIITLSAWVGLPSQRGTKSSQESAYLNELYRRRAEEAGIVYVDIWDGFVDE
jgi:uncharacterized protein